MISTYPDTFAGISYHLSDGYQVAFGNTRANFYGIQYIPDFQIDGLGNVYPNPFVAAFQARAAIPTDTTIALQARQISDRNFEVTAHVCIEAGGAAKTMRIYTAWVLDSYPPSEVARRNTCRGGLTVGDVTLDPDSCTDVSHDFTFDTASWGQKNEIELIGWAQEPQASSLPGNPAEVFQAAKLPWQDLVPAFAWSPQIPEPGQPVTFTDASTGAITDWEWDFGDGSTSTEQNPTHTFAAEGNYLVTLAVSGGGWTLVTSATVDVWPNVAPTASFTFIPSSPVIAEPVYFTDTSTGHISDWYWDFGDGATSTAQNPSHSYYLAGTYTVVLEAGNQFGSTFAYQEVTVADDASLIFVGRFESGDLSGWSAVVP
jgi:chitodextrinase